MVKKTLPFCLFSENTNTKKHFYNLAHSRKYVLEKSSSKVSTPSCNISEQILCKKVECTNKENVGNNLNIIFKLNLIRE